MKEAIIKKGLFRKKTKKVYYNWINPCQKENCINYHKYYIAPENRAVAYPLCFYTCLTCLYFEKEDNYVKEK